ncbi:MAG: hypothetical protein J6D53_05510 [Blautia sp.]|nr:hypothetical protein [Blautia sp.]
MGLFFKKTHPDLERLLRELEMDMSNNYKDTAQDDFAALEEAYNRLINEGKLSKRQQEHYDERLLELRTILKGYTHKDQKAVW